MPENYYDILGVPKTASQDEIKKSYRKLSKKHHPDAGGNEEEFKKISHAYDVLSDGEKKKNYDTYGDEKGRSTQEGFGDLHNQFRNAFHQHFQQQIFPKGESIPYI